MSTGLGEFLRSRRLKLTPSMVGLSEGRRRRTPGLRREEVAELAGIGVDWYIRLEQGRTVSPSATTINALALALLLDETEQAHLQALARGNHQPAFQRETVPGPLRQIVEGLQQPAYLTGRRWDLLVWNDAAAELLTDFAACAEEDRNILVYLLLDPAARSLFGAGWIEHAQRVVAQFRAAYDLAPTDPAFTELLDRLRQGCPELAQWWQRHEIRTSSAGQKTFHHPDKGRLYFEYATFQANDNPALKLSIYHPM